MTRREKGDHLTYKAIVETIRDMLPDALIVPNLGTNTAALMHEGARNAEFYMWGAMGLTHSIGLGLAMTKPDRTVLVLDGDGSLLMGLAGMATIGTVGPPNLVHIVLDNSAWGNTGGQPTHTARGVDLHDVARGCGYAATVRAPDLESFRDALGAWRADGVLTFIDVKMPLIEIERPPIDPAPILIKTRFMRSCNGSS